MGGGRVLATGPILKYLTKIGSHNILLERSLLDNDFDTNSFDDYLNFQVKIFIPRQAIRRGAILKFTMVLVSKLILPTPISKHLNKNIANSYISHA